MPVGQIHQGQSRRYSSCLPTVPWREYPLLELPPLLFHRAETVSGSHLFRPKWLPFERKPQIVVIVSIQR